MCWVGRFSPEPLPKNVGTSPQIDRNTIHEVSLNPEYIALVTNIEPKKKSGL